MSGWQELVSSLVGSLAWPVAAVLLLGLVFRGPVTRLIDEVEDLTVGRSRMRRGDKRVEKLQEAVAELDITDVASTSDDASAETEDQPTPIGTSRDNRAMIFESLIRDIRSTGRSADEDPESAVVETSQLLARAGRLRAGSKKWYIPDRKAALVEIQSADIDRPLEQVLRELLIFANMIESARGSVSPLGADGYVRAAADTVAALAQEVETAPGTGIADGS